MSKKISAGELLRLACDYAIQDRIAFIQAYKDMPDDPARIEAEEFLEQLREYQDRRWGDNTKNAH